MKNEIINQLDIANRLYKSGNYEDSLEIFEKFYSKYSGIFDFWHKIFYCWSIYMVHIKFSNDENELYDNVELITGLLNQADLNVNATCPYTLAVFKIIDYLYKLEDYYNLQYWFDKINPNLLDETRSRNNNVIYPSRKEKFYNIMSKTYFECGDFEKCIEVSNEALNSLTNFTGDNGIWHKWRIAKSLNRLNENKKALSYLDEIINEKNEWYIKKEIAENYFMINDIENASLFAGDAVLTGGLSSNKVNLYHLIYEILNEINPDIAFKHAELYYILKLESNAMISEDIVELDIDEETLNRSELEKEIGDYWYDAIYNNRKLEYGTVCDVLENGESGFILSNNLDKIYFNNSDFDGNYIQEGMYVSYFVERSFDSSMNKELIKAINIKEE